eukprot:CAMPEP_0202917360 /NCGR_PEP_ID=MMETSP1392-20130828/70822_1 /ASSEMBLY_ACC=CAM_ASM_000868 /TAXON_ID=225041 /ORGANISM="Chlamydomonas chlamydogama, Strain SAG 11-48b" /LENGTH=108 /DNA_ID=CAMNT_0049610095 /DNA_START=760 /DNA_END=1086 /DNA_ORIENTATION=+
MSSMEEEAAEEQQAAAEVLENSYDSDSSRDESGSDDESEDGSESSVSYYGVVVQERASEGSGNRGCYVLKTSRTGTSHLSGSACTHFSLTQVCQGQPLYAQLQGSWLL